jgi:hypothetical protein
MKHKKDIQVDAIFKHPESQQAFFKPAIKIVERFIPILSHPNQQEIDLKNQAINLFLATFKTISEYERKPEFLSQILGALAYYYLKAIKPPFRQFEQSQWVLADLLNEQALNMDPANNFAIQFKEKILNNHTGMRHIAPNKLYRTNMEPVNNRYTEIFNQSIDEFLTELDTIYTCSPEEIIPNLLILSRKVIPGTVSSKSVAARDTLIAELLALHQNQTQSMKMS